MLRFDFLQESCTNSIFLILLNLHVQVILLTFSSFILKSLVFFSIDHSTIVRSYAYLYVLYS
jgi:hypothetical protein